MDSANPCRTFQNPKKEGKIMFARKCMSIVLVVSFILAFRCRDLWAAEKWGNFSGMEQLRGVSLDASLLAHNLLYIEKMAPLRQHQASQAPMLPQLSDQTYLLRVNNVEPKEQRSEKPPLSGDRIAGEILAGGAGGIAVGFAGMFIGSKLAGCRYGLFGRDECSPLGAITGGLIGYPLGSAIGVYCVGNIGNETGSCLATLGGSILALGVLGLGARVILAYTPSDGLSQDLAIYCLFASPLIGATIGFNLTRRYKSPSAESETALINFRVDLVEVKF